MKKPSITPGDWRHYNSKGGRIYQNWRVIDKRKVCIAKIEELPGGESEMANAQAIAALPKLLDALEKLEAIGSGGVAMIHETGKPTWSALDEVKRITREALAAAGYTE